MDATWQHALTTLLQCMHSSALTHKREFQTDNGLRNLL